MDPQNEREAIGFTLRLGRALQVYGAPAHRLEDAMREIVESLGFQGEFFSSPTLILASLGSGQDRQTHLLRIEGTEVDLSKMSALSKLANDVVAGKVSLQEASAELNRVLVEPSPFPQWLTLLSFGVTSAAASRFFGAGWNELFLALAAGLMVGLLSLLATPRSWLARVFEPVAGLAVSLLATLGHLLVGPVSVPIVTVSGLIVLVPGLTLTVAINELAQRSLISGTARLHGAMTVFLMLGFGVAVGANAGAALSGGVRSVQPIPLAAPTEWIALLLGAVTLGILFRAPVRDFGWILLTCFATYLAVRTFSPSFGPELGVFIGAFVAGVASNVYARFLDRPAAVTRVPAMMLLVPGGLGFLGISSLLEHDILRGVQTAFSVAIMAVALVTGLLISNALVPPGKKL